MEKNLKIMNETGSGKKSHEKKRKRRKRGQLRGLNKQREKNKRAKMERD